MAFKFDAQAAADTLAQIDQNRFAQQQFNLKKDELAFNREMSLLNSYLDQKKAYSTKPKKGYDTQSLIDARSTLKSYIEDIDPEDMDEAVVVAVFDDRDKVVKMWREIGLTCMQVAPGNF